jgi:hypothetical protein
VVVVANWVHMQQVVASALVAVWVLLWAARL